MILLAAHLIGDFLFQNDWMQRKSSSSWVCTVHVSCYMIPFAVLERAGYLPMWALGAIALQHWLQDRFALHKRWMRVIRSTPEDRWSIGPLIHDQVWHIMFLTIIGSI